MDRGYFNQMALKTDSEESVSWEGDYREPVVEDFLKDAKPKPIQPLLIQHDNGALRATIFWSIVIVLSSLFNWAQGDRWAFMVNLPTVAENGEFYRLWTSLFIHSDFGHLASNLWLFAIFGYLLRSFWGLLVFPFLSFIAVGGLASVATIFWYQNSTFLLGASGMIYGMIGLWLVTYLRYELRYRFRTRLFRAIGFILVMLFPSTITENISYSAHFFGFFIGGLVGVILILLYGTSKETPRIDLS